MTVELPPGGGSAILQVFTVQLLDAAECAAAIGSVSEGEWREAGISGQDGTGTVDPDIRSVLSVKPSAELDWLFERLGAAIARLNDEHVHFDLWGTDLGDPYSILRYDSGTNDHYRPHRDIGATHPTRKLTAIVQLSDPSSYVGGDLVFPDENQRAQRDQGSLILFPSLLRHTVTPVVVGTRHALVGWVHGPGFR